jgi:regulation of enolase protein 1 (concanavalin A-like superfamily)
MADAVTRLLPFPLTPSGPDAGWRVGASGSVTATAPARTDFYVDPAREHGGRTEPLPVAPTLLGVPPEGDLRLSARVTVDFRDTYDAGVLMVRQDDHTWAKLCVERSPAAEPMVVSVVTRGVSDDANAFVVDAPSVWLRVARTAGVYAFHASTDGVRWQLVRVFSLGADLARHEVGLEVQSPVGDGCTVTFDDLRFGAEPLTDLRDGS